MLKIGLTGGIGSGKSTVAQIFRVLGVPVFDADRVAKHLMDTDPALRQAITAEFGPEAYTPQGLNRALLAAQVFHDPYRLEKLNAIVHPVTIAAARNWWQQQSAPYVVKEAALLFEAGTAEGLDFIIGVFAPPHVRLKRVMQRDRLEREQVINRMKRQVDDLIKMRLCDRVIHNDEVQPLLPQVWELHNVFLQKAAHG